MKALACSILCCAILSACIRTRSAASVHCLEEQLPNSRVYDPMREARIVAAAPSFRLPKVTRDEIQFEHDPRVCTRISQALGRVAAGTSIPGFVRPVYADIIVIRLGAGGYYVQSMWHNITAGEFDCHAFLFDVALTHRLNLCG